MRLGPTSLPATSFHRAFTTGVGRSGYICLLLRVVDGNGYKLCVEVNDSDMLPFNLCYGVTHQIIVGTNLN